MKLNAEYPVVEMDGEAIVVFAPNESNTFRGMLRLNPTAKFILECLKEETTEDLILQKLMEQFDGDESEMKDDIAMVIEKLHLACALEK